MEKLYKAITFRPFESIIFFFAIVTSIGLLATPYYKFAVAPGLLIFVLFILSRYSQFGYFLIVFMIPLDAYTGFSGAYQGVSISKFLGIWISIVILFHFLLNRKISFDIRSKLWPWFIIFFLICFVSTLMSSFFSACLIDLGKLFIAYTFFALTLIFITREGFSKTLPTIIILSIFISSFLAIIGYFFDIPGLTFSSPESIRRGVGPSKDPNFLSAMVIFSLPILIHVFFSTRRILKKFLILLLFVINIIVIILTHSRAGMLILLILFVLFFIEHIRRLKPKYLGFVGLFVLIVIINAIIFVPASYLERLKTTTDPTDTSIGQRASHLYVGWNVFKENPIIGSGPGSYKYNYITSPYAMHFLYDKRTHDGKAYRRAAHNSYIEVLTGTGILGITIFLIILWLTLKSFYLANKRFQYNGEEKMASLARAYMLSFISFISYSIFLSANYHKYLWLALALSQVALKLSEKKLTEQTQTNKMEKQQKTTLTEAE